MKSKIVKANILTLNCGSSSLKYKIIRMPDEECLVEGEAERVGIKTQGESLISHSVSGKTKIVKTELGNHSVALRKILALIKIDAQENKEITFDIFAHRYVHPGNFFAKPVKISKPVLKKLKETLSLAAIHNPITYGLIEFCYKEYRTVEQFAVFDTAFHRGIPPEFSTYALPVKISKKYGLKKIGFHGISHQYVTEEACRFLKRNIKFQKVISCHLGTGGSSVCAINRGKSVNTSMGFTPLEGLVMNTRCGDLDLGIIFYIMSKERFSPVETENILNKKSGILGIFSSSSDLRDVVDNIGADPRAKIAFDMYARRVKAYIGFYALILKKTDILVFTDSLGVGMPLLRESICDNMAFLGISLDREKNKTYRNGICELSSAQAQTKILVVPTNEELMIARETYKELIKK
ncbi:MAG: acetate/propionate family kinase [Candidatus Omnitrophica bacterium]|nr:acetate/propionate family kinase [Candidatus Omnitrophota bacterium]